MWKPEHRRSADRNGLRYPSDLTDTEWGIVEPMIPPARHGGRRRSVNVREVLNGIFYILWTQLRISQKRDSGFANSGTAVSLNHGQCGDGSFRLRG